MPLYEYECKKCHHRFEKIQTFSAKHVKKCPECGGPIEQLISAPSVQFKGSGWYVTDYAKSKPDTKETKPTPDAAKSDSAKTDSTKTDSTPASDKSDKKSDS